MELNGLLSTFPKHIKLFIGVFVIVLSIGYFTGLLFVNQTNSNYPNGIEENYIGNENEENADVMIFKKSKREMLTIVHTHILSMSFIFFLLGILVAMTTLSGKMKTFLMVEPFVSVILTFGGLYLLWSGVSWMKYVVMISGTVMTVVFLIAAMTVLLQLRKKK